MQNVLRARSISLAILLLALIATALPDTPKRARKEKFGSSLKRLKWDHAKRASTEQKAAPEKAPPGEAIRLETLFVVFDLLVVDPANGRFVTGLDKRDFIVLEEGQPQELSLLTSGTAASLPRSIILLLDASGSQLPYLEASLDAAKSLIGQLAPTDEMAIVSDNIELLIDFTADRQRLKAALDSFHKRARKPDYQRRSLQFSALFATLRELVTDPDRRYVVIFQTDGDEAASFIDQPDSEARREAFDRVYGRTRRYSLADIYDAAEKSRATVYTIIPSERLVAIQPEQVAARARRMLDRLGGTYSEAQARLFTESLVRGQFAASRVSEITGGWTAFLERPEEAAGIYSRILADINSRYVLGFYPANTARDGRLRRVKVEVRGHPEYKIEGRTSYYAPTED